MKEPVIVWFRQDLRLNDNPALVAALNQDSPLILLYILEEEQDWPLGGASRWWLHHSLSDFAQSIHQLGGSLILRRGCPRQVLDQVIQETGTKSVFWNRRYYPSGIKTDHLIKEYLKQKGINVHSFNSHLLLEPWMVTTKQGTPYQVFSPFWRTCLGLLPRELPLACPKHLHTLSLVSDELDSWSLRPTYPDWAQGIKETWRPGETGAQQRLDEFLEHHLKSYKEERDYPGLQATSKLSPHLQWGEISPRQVFHRVSFIMTSDPQMYQGATCFLSELGWREFCYHLLYHFPHLPQEPLRPSFKKFPWQDNADHLKAWHKGLTGYPIIDAGMRELWHTGWMHNRVRMLVASFLVKDLLIPWQKGEEWFWDTLVDADLASNSGNWQWVAGCGADAAPYFRIFNPVLQGEKFDPDGHYVRRWIPELARLPNDLIHKPWQASPRQLSAFNVILGQTYPYPIIDREKARQRSLAIFKTLK